MSTKTTTNVIVSDLDKDGNLNVLHAETDAKSVLIDNSNENLPNGVETTQDVINHLARAAFSDYGDVVYFKETSTRDQQNIQTSEVDDSVISESKTWSSAKLDNKFKNILSVEGTTLYINTK